VHASYLKTRIQIIFNIYNFKPFCTISISFKLSFNLFFLSIYNVIPIFNTIISSLEEESNVILLFPFLLHSHFYLHSMTKLTWYHDDRMTSLSKCFKSIYHSQLPAFFLWPVKILDHVEAKQSIRLKKFWWNSSENLLFRKFYPKK
jgi:hypothetical protein